ncbi:MAG TPA: NAD(+) diphosphatase [Nocardioidaceae bacterium]|nr:NAD(+) diphosphatase [Nocardioidaceae bacterium]
MPTPTFPDPAEVRIALSAGRHDRAGHRRADEAWLARAWADTETRVVVVAGARFMVDEEPARVRWLSPPEVVRAYADGRRLFLGEKDDRAWFAWVVADGYADVEPAGTDGTVRWTSFRQVLAQLDVDDAGLMVHAVALAQWLRSHVHCPRCGGLLEVADAGHTQRCTVCGRQQFPRADPAVIMLVTDGERALLGRQSQWPQGRYSTLAGFVDPGESFEQAVVREVAEETGVQVGEVRYFGNQPWPFPASLMIGFFARATSTEIIVDGDELSDARWFTRAEVEEQTRAGTLLLPGGVSISRTLVEAWYGGRLPGQW